MPHFNPDSLVSPGFQDPVVEAALGGIQPLWRDVVVNHKQQPMHVMLGGGDQIYCDDVWQVPALEQVGSEGRGK